MDPERQNKRKHIAEEDRPSKRHEVENQGQEVEHSSHVHGNIMARSLSHMPLVEAVRTTPKFGDTWLSMPRLRFNETFVQYLTYDDHKIDEAITCILRDHHASLEEFEFSINVGDHYSRIPDMLTVFAARNPTYMKIISLECPERIDIPMKLLSQFRQLEELKLKGCELVMGGDGGELGSLKLLEIEDVPIPTLRRVLSSNRGLMSLTLLGMPMLFEGDLGFDELGSLLPNVQALSIGTHFANLLAISRGSLGSHIYHHLSYLNIFVKVESKHHVTWALSMLKASPNLKSLYVTFDDDEEVTVEEKLATKEYLCSQKDLRLENLRGFNISNLTDTNENGNVQLTFIKFLLNNTPSLMKAVVQFGGYDGYATDSYLKDELLRMTRSSPTAEVHVSLFPLSCHWQS